MCQPRIRSCELEAFNASKPLWEAGGRKVLGYMLSLTLPCLYTNSLSWNNKMS